MQNAPHRSGLPSGLSVIIPVYNSAQSLAELIKRLEAVLATIPLPSEIILVNDGSADESWVVIRELASQHKAVRGLCLMRNYGQHNALLAGLRAARYQLSATLDDDLQHPPEEMPKLLAALETGYDVVYGVPQKEKHAFWRALASQLTKLALQRVMGAETARKVSAFRVFRTSLRDAFAHYTSPFILLDAVLSWGTSKFGAVPVTHEPRRRGQSNYTIAMLLNHAGNMMTAFSAVPLRLASLTGFAFAAFGLCVLIYVVARFVVEGGSVPGFPFLASIISIFSGAQLFAIGILGEYLARMHFRLMDKPLYVTSDSAGFDDFQ
jgi:glycosyltransferase involved in cell wall biosynthesis